MQNKYIILKSPVKIGDYERVASYSGGLTKGEEQLLVTRDLKIFLTDGKGGYLEFKSINSGITLDEVNQKLKDLDNKMSDKISDLDGKSSNDIKTLKDAVDALSLKFSGYVTTEDFDDLKTKVESNTTLATHDNREVLDKFSVDKDENPLFNGKKIVADFDTSGIEAEILDLKNRSVIGSSLDYGLFGLSTAPIIADNSIIPFDKVYSQSNLSISAGKVRIKAGRKYVIRSALGTNSTGNYTWFNVYNETDNIPLGKPAWSGTIKDTNLPCIASITPVKDIDVSIRVSSAVNNSYSIDSAFAQIVYFEVEEVGRTSVIDPCEDGKNINFEYGDFQLSSHMTTGIVNGALINFDKVNNGNLSISDNKVLLKVGKTYEIEVSLYCVCNTSNLGYIYFGLYNETDSLFLKYAEGVSTTYGSGYVSNPTFKTIFKPTKDTYISIKIKATGYIDTIDSSISYFIVKEMAQPYYFNYFKDSIKYTTLFEGVADTIGTYNLNDVISNYDHLIVYASGGEIVKSTHIVDCKTTTTTIYSENICSYQNANCNFSILHHFDNNKLIIDWMGLGSTWESYKLKIYKIVGVGFNYDNPYQDIITTAPDAALTDSVVDSDITSIWNGVGL